MKINDPKFAKLKFSKPANYKIKIKGILDQTWEYRLDNMYITEMDEEEGTTVIIGEMKDQAALAGILNNLYALHLPIISVTCI